MPEEFTAQLARDWNDLLAQTPRFGLGILILVVAWIAGRFAAAGLGRALARGRLAPSHRQFFRQLTVFAFVMLGLAIGLNLVGLGGLAAGLVAGGGMTAIVLGFAFRGIGENLLAGLFLAFSRPFEVGNLIRSGEHEGTVRSIAMRYTHVRTADGRDIYVPNAQIFNEPLVNYTQDGLLRSSYTFGIDWANDADRARTLLLATVTDVPGVLETPPAAVAITELSTNTVDLTVFVWLDVLGAAHDPRVVRSDVLNACRRALVEGGYTVSSNVAANVSLTLPHGLDARAAPRDEAPRN